MCVIAPVPPVSDMVAAPSRGIIGEMDGVWDIS